MDSRVRVEIIEGCMKWVATHGGSMPTSGRLDRRSWLSMLRVEYAFGHSMDAPLTSVIDGNTVIWIIGIPIRQDAALGPLTIEFEE